MRTKIISILGAIALAAGVTTLAVPSNAEPDDPPVFYPICTSVPGFDTFAGYDTAEDAEAAVASAEASSTPDCTSSSPTDTSTTEERPTTNHAQWGYHHNGQTVPADYQGGRATYQVKDISMPHPSNPTKANEKFLVSRVFMWLPNSSGQNGCQDDVRWAEVGWVEMAWRANNQIPYTFSSMNCKWSYYGQYDLKPGKYYTFRVQNVGGDAQTAIFWAGRWNVLKSYSGPDCYTAAAGPRCRMDSYTEIYSAEEGAHPGWTGKLYTKQLKLKKSSWSAWSDPDNARRNDTPYNVCAEGSQATYSVVKGSCP